MPTIILILDGVIFHVGLEATGGLLYKLVELKERAIPGIRDNDRWKCLPVMLLCFCCCRCLRCLCREKENERESEWLVGIRDNDR